MQAVDGEERSHTDVVCAETLELAASAFWRRGSWTGARITAIREDAAGTHRPEIGGLPCVWLNSTDGTGGKRKAWLAIDDGIGCYLALADSRGGAVYSLQNDQCRGSRSLLEVVRVETRGGGFDRARRVVYAAANRWIIATRKANRRKRLSRKAGAEYSDDPARAVEETVARMREDGAAQ